MDRLNFNSSNTLPVYLKDFEYLQDIYKKAFEGFARAVQNGTEDINFIISGCVYNPSAHTITEGFIYLGTEVLHYTGETGITTEPVFTHYKKVTTVDPEGTRTAGGGSSHDAYLENRAQTIYTTEVPAFPYLNIQGLRFADMIRNQANPEWITGLTLIAPYITSVLKYRKVGNYLEMKGTINNTTGVFSGNIFTITNTECRPIQPTKLPVIIDPIDSGYNAKSANLSINESGIVKLETADTNPTGYSNIQPVVMISEMFYYRNAPLFFEYGNEFFDECGLSRV